MENVADIYLQPRQAQLLTLARKDFARFLRAGKGAVIFTEKNKRLNGTAECARCLVPNAQKRIELEGLFVVFDGRMIIAAGVQGVGLRAETQGDDVLAAQPTCDGHGRLGQPQRLSRVHADLLHDHAGEALNSFGVEQAAMPFQEAATARIAIQLAELGEQLVQLFELRGRELFFGHGHYANPRSSKARRRRSIHCWRVKPMEPTAKLSSAA